MKVTNEDIFNALVGKEQTELHSKFQSFMELYSRGQELGCLPEQPTRKNVDDAFKKFEELRIILGYL